MLKFALACCDVPLSMNAPETDSQVYIRSIVRQNSPSDQRRWEQCDGASPCRSLRTAIGNAERSTKRKCARPRDRSAAKRKAGRTARSIDGSYGSSATGIAPGGYAIYNVST